MAESFDTFLLVAKVLRHAMRELHALPTVTAQRRYRFGGGTWQAALKLAGGFT